MNKKLSDFDIEQVREYCRQQSSELGTFVFMNGKEIENEHRQ